MSGRRWKTHRRDLSETTLLAGRKIPSTCLTGFLYTSKWCQKAMKHLSVCFQKSTALLQPEETFVCARCSGVAKSRKGLIRWQAARVCAAQPQQFSHPTRDVNHVLQMCLASCPRHSVFKRIRPCYSGVQSATYLSRAYAEVIGLQRPPSLVLQLGKQAA